jgi:hypothetical protein
VTITIQAYEQIVNCAYLCICAPGLLFDSVHARHNQAMSAQVNRWPDAAVSMQKSTSPRRGKKQAVPGLAG